MDEITILAILLGALSLSVAYLAYQIAATARAVAELSGLVANIAEHQVQQTDTINVHHRQLKTLDPGWSGD